MKLSFCFVYQSDKCPQTSCSLVVRLRERLLPRTSRLMRFPVSSEGRCHPLQHLRSHTRYSDVFLRRCQCVKREEFLPRILQILHRNARTVNCKYIQQHSTDDHELRQATRRFNAWRTQLDLKRSRPLRNSQEWLKTTAVYLGPGRTVPYVPPGSLSLPLFTYLTSSTL